MESIRSTDSLGSTLETNRIFQSKKTEDEEKEFDNLLCSQTGVDTILPYGDAPGQVANQLLLIKKNGTHIYKWKPEGEPEEIWKSPVPLNPTEITWEKGEPRIMLFSGCENAIEEYNYNWVLLYPNNLKKNESGREESWAPNKLSHRYLDRAYGSRIGKWKTEDDKNPHNSPPIPLHTKNGSIHFLIGKAKERLRMSTNRGETHFLQTETENELSGWIPGPHSLLLFQTNKDPINYLALINRDTKSVHLWNTDVWTEEHMKLENYGTSLSNVSIDYFNNREKHYLISCQKNTRIWLSQFNPETGTFITTTTRSLSQNEPSINHFIITPHPIVLLMGVGVASNETPGYLSVWSMDPEDKISLNHFWPVPKLKNAVFYLAPDGQSILTCIVGNKIQVSEFGGELF